MKNYIPWVSFAAGMAGSLHCVGMCGGLVTATCEKSHDIFRYQIGRLLGYLLLGLLAGTLGSFLNFGNRGPVMALLPALSIGGLLIFWGLQDIRGKRAELPAPAWIARIYTRLWRGVVQKNQTFTKAFFTGLISIFLPCGLLYGVVLGTVALQHTHEALFSMLFFWLGTVPSMVVAPGIVRRIVRPLKTKVPRIFAVGLLAVGVMTITVRTVKFLEAQGSGHTMSHDHPMSCHSVMKL